MDLKILEFREIPIFSSPEGFTRAKEASFTVNGAKHKLQISMKDFDAGKAPGLIKKEAEKITAIYDSIK